MTFAQERLGCELSVGRYARNIMCFVVISLLSSEEVQSRAKYITFDGPDCVDGFGIYDLNSKGVVVGICNFDAFIRATDGTITQFGVSGGQFTFAQSINSNEIIGGTWRDHNALNHGFVRATDGTITSFDVPGAKETYGTAINKWGSVTGYYTISGEDWHGFIRFPDGSFTTFDVKNASAGTYPRSINSDGVVAGDASGRDKGWGFIRYKEGYIKELIAKGKRVLGAGLVVNEISGSGSVVGAYINKQDQYHGFVRARGGAIKLFQIAGHSYTMVSSINSQGVAVGYYYTGNYHGFLRSADGKIKYIDVPGAQDTTALIINSKGVIAGGYDSNSQSHGFIRIP